MVGSLDRAFYAINGRGTVNVSGGFVFGPGAIYTSGTSNISGNAVVCEWNRPDGETISYIEGTSTGLTVNSGATATWGKNGTKCGIYYEKTDGGVKNEGFFEVSGVKFGPAVCQIGGAQYASLHPAIADVPLGEDLPTIIKLLGNITHPDNLSINNKKITFDLNGFDLVIANGLSVSGGSAVDYTGSGSFKIKRNLTGSGDITALYVDGRSYVKLTSVEITDARTGTNAVNGVSAHDGSIVVVDGDVKATSNRQSGSFACGIVAYGSSSVPVKGNVISSDCGVMVIGNNTTVTVDGQIITDKPTMYVNFGGFSSDYKTAAEFTTPTTKEGYLTYKKDTATVWVKDTTPVAPANYTVTFKPNNGTADSVQSVSAGGTAAAPADPTKTGHVFGGWYADAACTGPKYNFSTPVTANITLYAKWTAATYTVMVIGGTGGGSYAEGATVSVAANPAPGGKAFDKWTATGVTLTNPNNASTSFAMPPNNVALTATYKDLPNDEPPGPDPTPDPGPTTETGSMGNFLQANTYTPGMFADVDENEWYGYNDGGAIANAYIYGLMRGNSATTFNPTGNITLAEAITVAARVRSIYLTGEDSFVMGAPWYQVYVDYAVEKGIIGASDFADYTRAATRAEMAYIFSRALPAGEYAPQNTVNALPDVDDGTPYAEAVRTLYRAGVVGGNDAAGTFLPGANIKRCEAAAIITRVILPRTRIKGKTYG